jgi:hypothetical protein
VAWCEVTSDQATDAKKKGIVVGCHLWSATIRRLTTSCDSPAAGTTRRDRCDPVLVMVNAGNQTFGQRGLSPQDLRRMLREFLRRWADYQNEKPAGWLSEDWESTTDPAVLDNAAGALWEAGFERVDDHGVLAIARRSLEPIIARGLVRREHRFVRPPAIVKPEMLSDWKLWVGLRATYEKVGGQIADVSCEHWGETFNLIVCESCTAVFRPRRRVDARHCHLCKHRDAALPLGSPETVAAIAVGRPVTVSVPESIGNVVISWKAKTLIRCPECREPAFRLDLREAGLPEPS